MCNTYTWTYVTNCKHLKCVELTARPLVDNCASSFEGFAHYRLHCCKRNSKPTYIMPPDLLCSSRVITFAAHKVTACFFFAVMFVHSFFIVVSKIKVPLYSDACVSDTNFSVNYPYPLPPTHHETTAIPM